MSSARPQDDKMPHAYMLSFFERIAGPKASMGYEDGWKGHTPRYIFHDAYLMAYEEGKEARERGAHQ